MSRAHSAIAGFTARLRGSPRGKRVVHWLLFPPSDYRPRWWVRALVNPWVHHRAGIIRWRARLDTVPFHPFRLEKDAIIEDNCLINNVMGEVTIGRSSLVGVGSVVIGPVNIGRDVLLAQYVVLSGLNHSYASIEAPIRLQGVSVNPIVIGDGCWLGAKCIVLPGVHIGKNAVVAAGAVVTKDVPAFTLVAGNPARMLRQYDPSTGRFERWRDDAIADLIGH